MEFPNSYFEDEVREGFYIPSIMKKNWSAQLEVLEVVKKICEKHDITYFAEWGTMLGAVRHGGIIPWDDDIDICMKRNDYEKFLQAAEQELPEDFCVLSSQNSESMNMVTRVQNSRFPIISAEQMMYFHGFPYSMGIDIFVLDYLPKDEKIRTQLHELSYSIAQVNTRLMNGSLPEGELQKYLCDIERSCQVSIDRTKPIGPQLIRTVEGLFRYFDERTSSEVTAISIWLENEAYHFPKEYYQDVMQLPFENTKISVSTEYEALLNHKFAGYMNPVRIWDSHDYPGYQSQINIARESGIELLEYSYDGTMSEKRERLTKDTLKGKIRQFIPLFREAHQELLRMAGECESQSMTELLGECQNVAVQLGTMIEEEAGEGTTAVSILEQYCEQVFGIHECVRKGNYPEISLLDQCVDSLIRIVESEMKEKKEVVFIPYQAKQWERMHHLWLAAMADEDTDVYVIPAPYYYKDVFGNADKEQQYDLTGYPEEVTLTSYEEYNFEIHHPDQIFIQCPYDEYNFAMTIHPFFYAANLWQYTEQLIYVPGLAVGEITAGDERAKKMLKYYCNMPGVILSDKVLVSSENMKEIYLELLTDFAGEDTEQIWQERIVVDVSPENGRSKNLAVDIPAQWEQYIRKKNGQRKKVILYTTSASALLADGEKMIEKMKYVLQTFYDNREEITLIWRSDQAVRGLLRKKNPKLWRLYSELVQQYRQEDWGIFDDQLDDASARNLCDACYGDGGRTMNGCRVDGKPVMIQNVDVVY